MSTSLAPLDHVELGTSRVATQYSQSQNFLAFLAALLGLCNQLESALQQLALLPSVDAMSGVNLDVIGIIVGVSRNVNAVITTTYFGFADEVGGGSAPFGELIDPSKGARFYNLGEQWTSTTILADPEYQFLIRAKIIKNISKGTCEDIIAGLRVLFNTEDIKVTDNYDMSISIAVGRPLNATEKAMVTTLDILPRPAGVRIAGALTSYTPVDPAYTGGDPPYGDS